MWRAKGVTAREKKDAGEGWREVEPFNPSPAVAPVPILDSLVFQWLVLLPWLWEKEPVYRKQARCASHSLAGLGWRQRLAPFAAEKAPASRGVWMLQLTSSQHYLLPSALTPPHPSLSHTGVCGVCGSKRAEGSLEAAGPMLWLNPWGHLPGITIPCILRLHWRRLMTRFPVIDGSNDKKNKMLHHILAGVAQKDNSGSCLSSPSPLPLFPCTLAYGSCWGLKKKLCTVLFSSRHRGYHSILENQGCKQAKGEVTYFGRNEYLKYIIFALLASSPPPSQLVKLLLSPFLFRQMFDLSLLDSAFPSPCPCGH